MGARCASYSQIVRHYAYDQIRTVLCPERFCSRNACNGGSFREAVVIGTGRFDTIFYEAKNHSMTPKKVPECCVEGTAIHSGRFDKKQLKIKNSKLITKSAPGMGAVMRRRRRACFSARWRRPAEAPRTGGRGRAARAPAQKQRADKPHLSGQPDGGRFRSPAAAPKAPADCRRQAARAFARRRGSETERRGARIRKIIPPRLPSRIRWRR